MIIHTHPVALEMALFESIEILLNLLNVGGKIRLYPRKIQDRYVFGICFEGTIPSQADVSPEVSSSGRWASLQETMAYLGGTAKAFDSALEILLYFPQSVNT
jgi:hypothetical protein